MRQTGQFTGVVNSSLTGTLKLRTLMDGVGAEGLGRLTTEALVEEVGLEVR